MGAWGHWLITGMHPSHFQYTVNDTILCFVYHAPSFTNQKFLKKVNFRKIQDFHRGLRLVRRFQSFWVVKTLVKRTSAITLSILWMMTKAEYLIQRFQNPTGTILYNFEATWEIQISINRQILKWVITYWKKTTKPFNCRIKFLMIQTLSTVFQKTMIQECYLTDLYHHVLWHIETIKANLYKGLHMTIISYLIVIIFNEGIEKNDASERVHTMPEVKRLCLICV